MTDFNKEILINAGGKVYVRGLNKEGINKDPELSEEPRHTIFVNSPYISISGDIMTLINYENIPSEIPTE